MTNKNNNETLTQQPIESTLGLNPVIGINGKDLISTALMVLKQALR